MAAENVTAAQTTPPKAATTEAGEVPPSEVFRWLATYHIYQDQLAWSRTQTLVVIEAAILAGAFTRQGPLAPVVLLAGAALVCLLYRVILRDWQLRDHYVESLQSVVPENGINLFPPPATGATRGGAFVRWVAWGVIATNLVLAALKAVQVAGRWEWTLAFWLS